MVTYIFYCLIIAYTSSSIKKSLNFFFQKEKNDTGERVQKNSYSGMKIMTVKTTTMRTLYVHVVLNGVIFRQISYDIVPYARYFLPVSFFAIITLINYASSYRKI